MNSSEAIAPASIAAATVQKRPRSAATGRRASTPDRLIASARAAFARHGYDGASIRTITREAHANLGAVTYHFGSKHALYDAVLEQVLAPLARRVVLVLEGPGGALDRAEGTVRALFEHLRENPDMPHFMVQELAAGKTPPEPVVRALTAIIGRLAQLMREGQAAGEIRAGDPMLLALSLVYQPVHLTLVRRISRDILGVDQGDPDTRARVVEHAAAFARAGLARVPREEA
jgi:AcrR family transcriptional regulator